MHGTAVRAVSLSLAVIGSALILFMPQAWIAHNGNVNHLSLVAMLFGIIAGFIHGVGFQAKTRIFRYLLHPVLVWGLMGTGLFPSLYQLLL